MGNLSLVIHIYTTLPVHSCLGGLKEVSEETADMINCTQLNMLDKIILVEKYLFHLMCFKYYSENRVSMFKKNKTEDLRYPDLNKSIPHTNSQTGH